MTAFGQDPSLPNEPSDEDILREIQEEEEQTAKLAAKLQQEQEQEAIRLSQIQINQTIDNNATTSTNNEGQLARFQETLITTGSDASIVLIVILSIIFILQLIRQLKKHYLSGKIADDTSNDPLQSLQPREPNLNDMEMLNDIKSYPVYTTILKEREEFYNLLQQGNINPNDNKIKNLLLQRAIISIERFNILNRDATGIKKNWINDMLPKDIWDDYQNANQQINHEIQCIIRDNQSFGFQWGSYKNDIMLYARDEWHKKLEIQKQDMQAKLKNRAKLQQQYQQSSSLAMSSSNNTSNNVDNDVSNNDNNNNNNNNNNNEPDDKNFGSGFAKGFLNKKHNKKSSSNGLLNDNNEQDNNIHNSKGSDVQSGANQKIRQRKGKRRFKTK